MPHALPCAVGCGVAQVAYSTALPGSGMRSDFPLTNAADGIPNNFASTTDANNPFMQLGLSTPLDDVAIVVLQSRSDTWSTSQSANSVVYLSTTTNYLSSGTACNSQPTGPGGAGGFVLIPCPPVAASSYVTVTKSYGSSVNGLVLAEIIVYRSVPGEEPAVQRYCRHGAVASPQ